MKYILFNPHSFVDVITNSSSELFIGKAKHDDKTIEELLREMLNLHNKINGTNYEFSDCFGTIGRVNDNLYGLLDECSYFGIPWALHFILDKYGEIPIMNYSYSGNWDEKCEIHKRDLENYYAKISNEDKQILSEYVIIESAEDNSIPYELFELIESMLENGSRIHLG